MIKATTSALSIALAFSAFGAENLIFNSNFELGTCGFECVKTLQMKENPSLVFEGLRVDAQEGAPSAHCLLAPNRFAEKTEIFAREAQLKEGAKYTLSFYAKSDAPQCSLLATIGSTEVVPAPGTDGKTLWDGCSKAFSIGGEWKRFSFNFVAKKPWNNKFYYIHFVFGREMDAQPGSLWLAKLQLEEGGLSEWKPDADVELGASASKILYVLDDGKPQEAEVEIRAANNSGKDAQGKLTLAVMDEFNNKTVFSQELPLSLKARETLRIRSKVPVAKFGTFLLLADAACEGSVATASCPGRLTVIGECERKTLSLDKDFCVGVMMMGGGAGFSVIDSHNDNDYNIGLKKPGFTAYGWSQDEFMGLLENMGCRVIREWSAFCMWKITEPAEGEFDFRMTDMIVDAESRHGIITFPIFPLTDFTAEPQMYGERWPSWLAAKCVRKEKSGDWGKTVLMPDEKVFRNYVRTVAERYKGRIPCYEITNEPNGWLSAEDYLPYLKAAYEEIKAADPACEVAGFSVTGDRTDKFGSFMEKCFAAGGLKYADVVTFHPYGNPGLASALPADKQIDSIKSLMEKYGEGRKLPLWNSELFYLRNLAPGEPKTYVTKGRHQPSHAASRLLTDLGEGVGQSICLERKALFDNFLERSVEGSFSIGSYGRPNGDFVAYNALARLFEGAKPVGKLRWSEDSVCYVYENGGKPLAAFWSYGGMKGLSVSLDVKPDEARLFDIFGNEQPLDGKPVALDENPRYMLWKNGDARSFVEVLKKGVASLDRPVSCGAVRLIPERGEWKALLALKNWSGAKASGKASVFSPGFESRALTPFEIAPNSECCVLAPAKLLDGNGGAATALLDVAGSRSEWPLKTSGKPRVCQAPFGVFGKSERLAIAAKGSPSQHASFKASWSDEGLALDFEVVGVSPSGATSGGMPWEQDCIELFFDNAPSVIPALKPELYREGVWRIFILPFAPQGKQLESMPANIAKTRGLKLETKKRTDGFNARLLAPLAALGLNEREKGGAVVGFDVASDAPAGAGAETRQLSWNSHGEAYSNRLSFGFIELGKRVALRNGGEKN